MGQHLTNKRFFHYCKYLFQVSLFSLSFAIALETDSSYAQPIARLKDWHFYPEALQLEIYLTAASQPHHFYLARPPRIVVDLPGTKLGNVSTRQNYSGGIQGIRVSQLNADVTRIVLDLAPGTFIDPTTVLLQPVSPQNPTHWVLRPSISSNETYLQPSNLPPSSENFQPTTIYPPIPDNLPPNIYPPQPPSNLPSSIYPPQPSDPYNTPSSFNVPPSFTNLPPTSNDSPRTPFVQVPPLRFNDSFDVPNSALTPSFFPNQPGNYNNSVPSSRTPNFPVPNIPDYPPNFSNPEVIDFGQPFPTR